MILTCPNCGTQYVVKDGAIPAGGRQVRCASCKHSWHENPEHGGIASSPATAELAAEAPEAVVAPASAESGFEGPVGEQPAAEEPVADDGEQSLAEATLIDPRSGPEAEERAFEEAAIKAADDSAVPVEEAIPATSEVEAHDDEFAPFPLEEDYSDERQRSPLLTIALIVIAVAVIAAAFWFFAPDAWKVRLGLAAAGASPLALVTTHMDRQRLQSGNELLTVTGRVINPTGRDQDVPPLQAQLRSRGGKLVYKWTIAPPARSLAPGASASFNSAEVNVPPGGDELTISVGPPPSA